MEERAVACCTGKTCFGKVAAERNDNAGPQGCPYIQARYGAFDPCRCCERCVAACRKDIEEPHG